MRPRLWPRNPAIFVALSIAGIATQFTRRFAVHTGWMHCRLPVSGAVTQKIIDVLAVFTALRATFPSKAIYDLKAAVTCGKWRKDRPGKGPVASP